MIMNNDNLVVAGVLLMEHTEIKREDGRFESDNETVNALGEQFRYIEVPNTNGKVYILKHKNGDTVYFRDTLTQEEVLNAGVQVMKMGVNPKTIIGEQDNMMTYRENIDPNIQMLKKSKPGLNTKMLLVASLATVGFMLYKNREDLLAKYRAWRKKRRAKMEMGIENDEEDEEELKAIYGHSKHWDTYKKYAFMNEKNKVKEFKKYIVDFIDRTPLSEKTKADIRNDIETPDFYQILANSITPKHAMANIIESELGVKNTLAQLAKSYDLDPSKVLKQKLTYDIV